MKSLLTKESTNKNAKKLGIYVLIIFFHFALATFKPDNNNIAASRCPHEMLNKSHTQRIGQIHNGLVIIFSLSLSVQT